MKQHQSNMNSNNKVKVKPIPPKKPIAISETPKVSNLRSRFESFKNDDHMRIYPTKAQPKPKIVLIRNESTRNDATLEYRKALIVDIPLTKERPTTSMSMSDNSRCSDEVFAESAYENLRVQNIRVNANFNDEQSCQSKRPETSIYEDIDISAIDVSSTVSDSHHRNFQPSSLINQSTHNWISMNSKVCKPTAPPKPSRPTFRLADKTNSVLLKDLMKDIEILNMKQGLQVDEVSIQRVSTRRVSDERISIDSFESTDDETVEDTIFFSDNITKTQRIIQELIENEQVYISTLKQGIDSYVAKFNSVELPDSLIGQKRNLFSNIEAIHDYHKDTFLPRLVACGFDTEKIAEAFTTSINRYQFDIYIIYVLKRQKSEKLCKENEYFFKQIQEDRLGVRSFLLQPVQRLPRYQLLLGEILKSLMKNLDANKSPVKACCIAEKTIQRLLNDVNEHC